MKPEVRTEMRGISDPPVDEDATGDENMKRDLKNPTHHSIAGRLSVA